MNKNDFISLLSQNGIILNEDQITQFDLYFRMLVEYNKVMNLTAIVEESEVYEKHFYDSLLFSFNLDFNGKSLIDVGSGAGFPGIPLSICYPNAKITLLEPLTKRCKFLENVIDALHLNNVTIVNSRSEDYSSLHQEEFDYVTARAVSRLNLLIEIVAQFPKVNGLFIALKGKNGFEELKEAENAMKKLNFIVADKISGHLPSENDSRINIYLKKVNHVPSMYPRNYGQIKKRPL
jgi:16S rRNA (guanine527-N7)-methyltransferase